MVFQNQCKMQDDMKGKDDHISVTLLPEQDMPFQDSPQGSPSFAFQFVSWPGEFRLVNMPLRTEAGNSKTQVINVIICCMPIA